MRRLSDLPDDEAAAELRACCASERWIARMLSQRPFKDRDEVFAAAERIWLDLGPDDWREALRAQEIATVTGDELKAAAARELERMRPCLARLLEKGS